MAAVVPGTRTMAVRVVFGVAVLLLAAISAVQIVPEAWPEYAVFFVLAFVFSFVWLDSDAPTSVPHMATATAFVYIAGLPILFFELIARVVAYRVMFFAARRGWILLPRPLRPFASADRVLARRARIDFGAMLGLASIGLAVRVAVVHWASAAGIESPIAMVALGEPTAYAVMGCLSALLPLPTGEYVVAAPQRLPAEDERVDVIFSAVLIVPFLVLLIVYGWLEHGLVGAAAWSLTSLAPHGLVQLLIRRRHLLDERHVALERATASLARKQDEIEYLTHTMTHDVKGPVSSINVTATGLVRAPGLSEQERKEVKRIVRLAEQTEEMIRSLLHLVRVVSDPEPIGIVDLNAVTAAVLDVLQPQISARRLRVDLATPLPAVPGQATKLRHVISNLIENAIRFVPPDTGEITLSAQQENGAVIVSVRDNGIGIPVAYHQTIFELFRCVPDQDAHATGSGMGLAIVKRIIEGHGGRAWVDSAPGTGATFRISLPDGDTIVRRRIPPLPSG